MALHSDLTQGSIHTIFNWIWADGVERAAETIDIDDINKIGLQEDTGIVYRLEDTTPTWTPFAGATALDDLTDVDANSPSNLDILVYNSVSGNWEAVAGSTLSTHTIEDAVTTVITPAVTLYHRTTGTAAQGFGTGLDVYAENPGGSDTKLGGFEFSFGNISGSYNYPAFDLNLTDTYENRNPVFRIGAPFENTITPLPVGLGSIDLQTYRSANTQTSQGEYSAILGAVESTMYGTNCLITGGDNHNIGSSISRSAIIGGTTNTITGSGDVHSILGGKSNTVNSDNLFNYNSIVNGQSNTIDDASKFSTIGGSRLSHIYQSVHGTIIGGYAGLISGIDYGFIGGGNYNRIDGGAGSQNFIGIGLNNRIYASYYGFIGDGYGNIISAPDSYNVIVNGENNQIQGIVKGDRCLIGTGSSNFIQETGYGSILNGKSNHVGSGSTSAYGLILTGTSNLVVSSMGTVITGKGAYVNNYAQVVSAGGTTDGQGTIQMVANRTVTHSGTGAYELYLDNTVERINIAAGSVWTFETLIVGSDATLAKRQSYIINGAISNVGGTTTILASNKTVVYEDDANFDANVNTASGYLIVEVSDSGSSGTTMKWTATIRTAEITP